MGVAYNQRSGKFECGLARKPCKGGLSNARQRWLFSFLYALTLPKLYCLLSLLLQRGINPKFKQKCLRMQNVYFRLTRVARKKFSGNASSQTHQLTFPSRNIYGFLRIEISFQQYFRLFLVCRIKNYSDYLQGLHKEDRLYEYNNTKDPMKKILSEFYQNCRLRIENLKVIKHR